MVLRPYWVVLWLTVYLPFEDFMLKWLPVSDSVLTALRLGSEAALYSLLLIVIANRLWKRLSIRKTSVDMLLLAFIALAVISIFFNAAPLLGSLINMRVLVRYFTVYYVVVNLNLTRDQIQRLIFLIIVIAFGESLIAILQHFIGISDFWLPRESAVEVAGYQKAYPILSKTGIEEGASIGTFGHSVAMGLYLLIAEMLILGQVLVSWKGYTRKKVTLLVLGAFILIAICFSYSRGLTLSAFLAFPIMLFCLRRHRLLFTCLFLGGFVLCLLIGIGIITHREQPRSFDVKSQYVNPIENVGMLFTKEYFERTSSGRQWILKEVGKTILISGTPIGFGPDEWTTREKIVTSSGGSLQRLISYHAFEDVFWIAMLAYYGFIGLSLFLLVLLRIYKASIWVARNSFYNIDRVIGITISALILILLPMTFIIKTFEFRTFSYYFWLMSGLVMATYTQLKSRNLGVTPSHV